MICKLFGRETVFSKGQSEKASSQILKIEFGTLTSVRNLHPEKVRVCSFNKPFGILAFFIPLYRKAYAPIWQTFFGSCNESALQHPQKAPVPI